MLQLFQPSCIKFGIVWKIFQFQQSQGPKHQPQKTHWFHPSSVSQIKTFILLQKYKKQLFLTSALIQQGLKECISVALPLTLHSSLLTEHPCHWQDWPCQVVLVSPNWWIYPVLSVRCLFNAPLNCLDWHGWDQDLKEIGICPGLVVVQPTPQLEVISVNSGEYGMVSGIIAQNYSTLKHLTLVQLEGDIEAFQLECKMNSKQGVVLRWDKNHWWPGASRRISNHVLDWNSQSSAGKVVGLRSFNLHQEDSLALLSRSVSGR